jgi:hypothetical protein
LDSTLVTNGTNLGRGVLSYPNVLGRIGDVITGIDGTLFFTRSNCDAIGGQGTG